MTGPHGEQFAPGIKSMAGGRPRLWWHLCRMRRRELVAEHRAELVANNRARGYRKQI
jgi:hypothetical protein